MIINNVYINPDNVFSVELIESSANFIRCLINSEMEYILTQKGTIRGVDNEFDVINETYELMKEDIISSLRCLSAENLFDNLSDRGLKSSNILKHILTEFKWVVADSYRRRCNSVLEEIVSKHFGKTLKTIKENYKLRTVELTPTNYILRVTAVNNYVDIVVYSRLYNLNNTVEFFNEIKNPVNVDDLRNYWYSKFENKIQI